MFKLGELLTTMWIGRAENDTLSAELRVKTLEEHRHLHTPLFADALDEVLELKHREAVKTALLCAVHGEDVVRDTRAAYQQYGTITLDQCETAVREFPYCRIAWTGYIGEFTLPTPNFNQVVSAICDQAEGRENG